MSTKWFGPESWGAPLCKESPRIPIPAGNTCAWCDEQITIRERGVAIPFIATFSDLDHYLKAGHIWIDDELVPNLVYHIECHLRQVVGSITHQHRVCQCFGGPEGDGDPAGMTKRQAAREAVRVFTSKSREVR